MLWIVVGRFLPSESADTDYMEIEVRLRGLDRFKQKFYTRAKKARYGIKNWLQQKKKEKMSTQTQMLWNVAWDTVEWQQQQQKRFEKENGGRPAKDPKALCSLMHALNRCTENAKHIFCTIVD